VISETEGNVLTLNLLAKRQRKLDRFERDRLESLFRKVAAKGLVKRKDKDNFLKKVSSFVNYKGKDQDQVKENMRETLDQVNNAFDKYNRIVQKHLRLANKRSKAWQKLGKNSVILTKKRTDHWVRVIKNALKSNPQARIFVIGGRKHFSERFHQQMNDFKVASFNPSFDHKVLSCEAEKWEKMFK
jgi:predicted transcriptional regulator